MRLEPMTAADNREAYELLTLRTTELIERGTGQYTAPYPPRGDYEGRTARGENWLVRSGAKIAGIVSLTSQGLPPEWKDVHVPPLHYWVSSLFVHPDCKNQGIGTLLLDRCKEKALRDGKEALLLDCYLDSGFLQPYYAAQGFETLATQTFHFGKRVFDAALMRYEANR